MSLITLIEAAKESAKAATASVAAGDYTKPAEFSETLSNGDVVTCIAVLSSNAFQTTVGHAKMTWKLNGKRATSKVIESLYLSLATDAERTELAKFQAKQKWLKKFGF